MEGHARFYENPEGWGDLCHCAAVIYPIQGEEHDEYSAYRADLVDTYISLLEEARSSGPYWNGMHFEIGKILRNKTPEYLQSLIASFNNSRGQMTSDNWPEMNEDQMDVFVKLGVHLNLDGFMALRTWVNRISDNKYFDIATTTVDPYGVLSRDGNLKKAKLMARLHVLLTPSSRGWSWRHEFGEIVEAMLPALERRPDMLGTIAAFYNKEGYTDVVTQRALGLIEDGTMAAPLTEGFL